MGLYLCRTVYRTCYPIRYWCCCRYKGSMDARSFQHHAARVAELTDALLAERAADKAAGALGAKDRNSEAAAVSGSATPSTASSPDRTASLSPSKAHGPAGHAAPTVNSQVLFTPERAGNGHNSEALFVSRDGHHLCSQASNRDSAAAASSSTSASAGGKATSFLPSDEALLPAGVSRGPYYCTVCNVATTSAVHLQTHYMGSKHQRRLAQNQDSREHNPHYCPICAISATSAVHLQLHLNGRAHQRKAKLASQAEGSQDTPAAPAESSTPGGTLSFLTTAWERNTPWLHAC